MNERAVATVEQEENPVAGLVKEGLAIMRLENETQMQMSVARPRNEKVVLEKVISELMLCPEFAKTAFYSIPYKDYSGDAEKTVWVEGLSIKAAMALARRWGNCSNGARLVEETDDRISVEGVFLDYETNMRTLRPMSVAKLTYNKKTKAFYPLNPNRLNMAIQSGMSKAVRNAILASIPESIKELYFQKAKELTLQNKNGVVDKKDAVKDILAGFAELGVTKTQIAAYLGKTGMNEKDAVRMRGLLTAIQDGQVRIAEVFGQGATPQATPQGGMSTDDVLGKDREPGLEG